MRKIFLLSSLKANIVANFFGNAWAALVGLICIPLYLKYLGAEAYGLIGIFASIQTFLFLLDGGLSITLNKEIAGLSELPDTKQQLSDLVKTLGSVYWALAFFAGLIAILVSPYIATYWVKSQILSINTITSCFILLSISIVFQFPIGFYAGGMQGLQKQVLVNGFKIFFSTLRAIGSLLLLIFVSRSILLFFSYSLSIAILQALTYRYFLWELLPKGEEKPAFDLKILKSVFSFTSGIFGITITAILLTQVDKIILSKLLPLSQFGYYTVACSLGGMISQLTTPLTQSYFPRFSILRSLNKYEDLKRAYHQACQMISVVVLPIALILVFFSKELIFAWTHDAKTVENTWLITSIYAFGTALNAVVNIPCNLAISQGWTKFLLFQNIGLLVLIVPFLFFFTTRFGAEGGAMCWVLINVLYLIATPYIIHKKFLPGELSSYYWDDTLKQVLFILTLVVSAKFILLKPEHSLIIKLTILSLTGLISIAGAFLLSSEIKPVIYSGTKFLKVLYKGKSD